MLQAFNFKSGHLQFLKQIYRIIEIIISNKFKKKGEEY